VDAACVEVRRHRRDERAGTAGFTRRGAGVFAAMKVQCPTCDRRGFVYFAWSIVEQRGFLFKHSYKNPSTGEWSEEYPTEKCQSCNGDRWIEQKVDITASVEIK
jgi:hypothetical protein